MSKKKKKKKESIHSLQCKARCPLDTNNQLPINGSQLKLNKVLNLAINFNSDGNTIHFSHEWAGFESRQL